MDYSDAKRILSDRVEIVKTWCKHHPRSNYSYASDHTIAINSVDPTGVLRGLTEISLDSLSEQEIEVFEYMSRDYVYVIFSAHEIYS